LAGHLVHPDVGAGDHVVDARAHASRFVRRDAWRIASTETDGGIDNVAFENADDDSRVLLVANSGDTPREITVREGGRTFSAMLPARSIATFRWAKPD